MFWLAWSERGWEDHNHRNSRRLARPDFGGSFDPRSFLARKCARNARVAGNFFAGNAAFRETFCARDRRTVCQLLSRAAFVRGGAGAASAHRESGFVGRETFRWATTAASGGYGAGVQSENPFSGRADDWPRSAEPSPVMGYYSRIPAQWRHSVADHALHGRS